MLFGCAGQLSVKTNYDDSADFTNYRTFAQAPLPPSTADMPGYGEITGRQIQRRIASQLEQKGLQPAGWDEADLQVRFSIGGQRYEQADDSVARDWADPTGDTPVDGSLVIDIADRRQRQLIWRGFANEDIFSQPMDGDLILRAVDALLAEYPPSRGAK
jgi:hypothetical protein